MRRAYAAAEDLMKKNMEMGSAMEEMGKKARRMEVELEISRRLGARTTMENDVLRGRNQDLEKELEKKGKGVRGWLKRVIGGEERVGL